MFWRHQNEQLAADCNHTILRLTRGNALIHRTLLCLRRVHALRSREGVLFEDDRFRPRPSSLDGRPGKGSAASQDDERGGGAEKSGRENAEVRVRNLRGLFF